jgi:putative heme-binding domain-containing protein|nr:MAG: heme-binding domain protein [Bacteroidota bacterium]
MAFVLASSLLISSCSRKPSEFRFASYVDTTAAIYGPYVAVKLPLTKGVTPSNPIQLALGPAGVLYACNQTGEVYSLRDTDGDGLEDTGVLYCNVTDFGLRSPGGFTHKGDTIYIGTAQQIRAFRDLDNDGDADTSWVFFDDIPYSAHPYEWTSGLTFGPDGWLYVAMSTDSWNAGPSPDPHGYRGSIIRISPDGKQLETVATGVRSVFSMAFNSYGDLFFIDNEGGGNPHEELNRVVKNGFYGHNPAKYEFDSIIGPELTLETETAPSGIRFNSDDNDFGGTAGNLFISFYGAGERWTRGGIGRVIIKRNADGIYSYEEFPVADIPKLSALAFGSDGSLYVAQHGKSDYWYNAVYDDEGVFYKLIYEPGRPSSPPKARNVLASMPTENSIEAGKQIYAEYACLACHAVDGDTELLGPNMVGIASQMSREEILEDIRNPSLRIKPSMGAVRITKTDDKVLIGRVVNSDENTISLMVVGNQVVRIPREDIRNVDNEKKSLMYEGLLNNLSEEQIESLLDYIVSLGAGN